MEVLLRLLNGGYGLHVYLSSQRRTLEVERPEGIT